MNNYIIFRLLMACLLLAGTQKACGQEKNMGHQAGPLRTGFYTYKTPAPGGTGKVYRGREIAAVMGAGGGRWLERRTRQQEEHTAQALAAMPLQANSVVADMGAGTGYYTFRIAAKVPRGKVYAVEVQEEFLQALKRRKKELGWQQVVVVKGTPLSPNLPDAALDLVLLVDVYHELAFPHEMLQAICRALKPSGKLLVLEYRAEDPAVPVRALHKMRADQVSQELAGHGLRLCQRRDFLPWQHFLLYERAR